MHLSIGKNGAVPLVDPGKLLRLISALWRTHPHTVDGVWLVARSSESTKESEVRVIEFHCDAIGCRRLFGTEDAARQCADRLNGHALRLIVTEAKNHSEARDNEQSEPTTSGR